MNTDVGVKWQCLGFSLKCFSKKERIETTGINEASMAKILTAEFGWWVFENSLNHFFYYCVYLKFFIKILFYFFCLFKIYLSNPFWLYSSVALSKIHSLCLAIITTIHLQNFFNPFKWNTKSNEVVCRIQYPAGVVWNRDRRRIATQNLQKTDWGGIRSQTLIGCPHHHG